MLERRCLPTAYLWLDFAGAVVTQARAGGVTLPDTDGDGTPGPVTIPKFDLTLEGFGGSESKVINYVLNFVREDYAAYDLKINLSPPFPEPYTTIYIGGSPTLVGKASGTLGIASTIDVGNKHEIPNGIWNPDNWDTAFVFPDAWAQAGVNSGNTSLELFAEQLATVISHEAGHTFGLRHIALASPLVYVNDVSEAEGNSGPTSFNFIVSLSTPSDQTVTVGFATSDGSATSPADYIASSGMLTFNPGETTETISVIVNGDTDVEPNETFFINLANPTNATLADNQALGMIVNDDSVTPALFINDVTQSEGNSGATIFAFTASLSQSSTQTVTVQYATADGLATAPSDYTSASGTLTFAPGETSKTITVGVIGDTAIEPDETFFVNLSNPTKATIADSQGVGTILNDDGFSISIMDPSIDIVNGAGTRLSFGTGFLWDDATQKATSVTVDTALLLGQNLGWKNSPALNYGSNVATATPLADNSHIEGILRNWGDSDFFQFTAVAGTTYTMATHTTGFGNLDTFLTVLDSSGGTIVTDDNSGGGPDGMDSRLAFTPTISGTYFLKVSSAGGTSSGSYILDVSDTTLAPHITLLAPGPLDFGNVIVSQKKTLSFVIRNDDNETLDLSAVNVSGSFTLTNPILAANALDDLFLAPGQSTTLLVTYQSTAHGTQTGTVAFVGNGSVSLTTLDLSGNGVDLIQSATSNRIFRFTDSAGNPALIRYKGVGTVAVVFDPDGVGVKITSATFSGNGPKTKWTVSGAGTASVGSIIASGGGFSSLIVQGSVDSMDINGSIRKLTVGSLDGTVDIGGSISNFRVNGVASGTITVGGDIHLFQATGDIDSTIHATGIIGKIKTSSPHKDVDGDLNGNVTAAAIRAVILEGLEAPSVVLTPAPLILRIDTNHNGI